MEAFPAYFPLSGRTVVIAGEGPGAEAKARLFVGAPARVVRLVGEAACEPGAYEGAVLAFVASEDEAFRTRASAAARAAGVLVNVADQPAMSDFYTPSVIDRGQVVAAIGTDGASPMLASMLRGDIEARVPAGAGKAAALFKRHQEAVRAAFSEQHERRAFLRAAMEGDAVSAAMSGDAVRADALFLQALAKGLAALGAVRVIDGRGPAEDLTLKAARVLSSADILVVDPACDPKVVELARRDAERIEAGSERWADLAAKGLSVVVLAAGDGSSQVEAARSAGAVAELIFSGRGA